VAPTKPAPVAPTKPAPVAPTKPAPVAATQPAPVAATQPVSRRRFSPLALFEALATPHGIDRYLELVNPMLTVRDMRAEITEVRRSTADSVTLTLRPTRQWRGFRAGQFVQLTMEIDGVNRTRCYSPACSQYRSDGRIELTVKAHPAGLVSRYLYANAAPGMVVGLAPAGGAFQLPDERPAKILLISGGSGITPVLAMLRTLCDEGYDGELTFLHYGRSAAGVPYRDELQQLASEHPNVNLVMAYRAQEAGGDLHGYFDQRHLDAAAPWHAEAETFLCGPPGLMRSVRERYEASGLAERLHTEDFATAPIVADAAAATGAVTFERSGIAADNSGATLLEQAEAAGLTPEYGCRMGICFSCTQVKTAGCTRNVKSGELDSDPDTEIQMCISVPVGDVAVNL
ncbi:MAG: stearoyl-CoA 9-desaturase oxidoreductase, partial [Pseudonocardiales bacterium]|nr:stearoyl-CoA 9-desaturase oxidoreductase [Pseudonocardiales bacterium]